MKCSLFAATFVWVSTASAAPPLTGADPGLGPWFRDLRQPGTGTTCCDESDCRLVPYRLTAAGHEVYIKQGDGPGEFMAGTNAWVKVPTEHWLRGHDNPTGEAVACWTPYGGVLCFIDAPKT